MDKQVTTSQISQFLKLIQTEQNELQVAKKELNFQITELELIIKNLRTEFPNQFQKKLVPFGSFAFMKGSVSETKLITVFLGDDWFVKVTVPQGIEILERRKARIEEKMELVDEELNQLKVKIQTTEGLLTGNMLGKNEDGLDFFEIRETEEDEMKFESETKSSTSTQVSNNSQIKEVSNNDDDEDDVLSEEETIIPEGASVVKLKILENDPNQEQTEAQPLTQDQIENKKYLDQIFANYGYDEEDDDDYYDQEGEGEEEDEHEEDYMGYGLNYNDDEGDDEDWDYDEDEDSDDFESYYKNLPAWAKKSLGVTSSPTASSPQSELKSKKKKKNVSFAPDVEEPTITVRKPADIKHRIQQMLDQNTPNAKTIQTPQSTPKPQPKSNNPETMKLNVVEREVSEDSENEEDLEAYNQKKEELKEAREYVDRYKTKMNKFKFEHEYEEGIDRQLIRENVQLSDNIELEANFDWQENALANAFDKQMRLDEERDGIFSSSTRSAPSKSETVMESSEPEVKPKKVSKFKLSRQQK